MKDAFERELSVFSAVRRLPLAERGAYLDKTCAGDTVLRHRVEELLRAGEDGEGFLKDPAPGADRPGDGPAPYAVALSPATTGEKAGDRIGRYKLLQQIGEGGCGLVYMAEQEEPVRRRVALKVIKLGMDTKQVIARFEAERQALAMMDHPNIAKVLDAGTTESGRPYVVMELVKGIKITDYCDEHNVSTKERLELFIQVCHAVQHAHQKGIIHRDLKPSNILVASDDGLPVPKVIDFGIAKAAQGRLTDQTVFTAFEQFIGTPAYMSPEQAELTMQDVDTRTDIYSLGVLLYELLTGKTPFDAQQLLASGLDAMRRTIREQEPERPSTKLSTLLAAADVRQRTSTTGLAIPSQVEVSADSRRQLRLKEQIKLVRGDLDWIVMKCLEKDRSRRYDTANGLADDVRHHLECEPVSARPPSRVYRFQRLVHRNKLLFGAGSAVVAAMFVGLIGTSIGFVRSQQQHRLAQASAGEARKNFDTARAAVDDLLTVADRDLYDRPGMEPLRVKLWRTAIDRYKPILERPSADAGPRAELARLYVKYAFAAEWNGADREKIAGPTYQSALAIQNQLVREHPQDRRLRSDLAWTLLLSVWFVPGGAVRTQSLAQAAAIFETVADEAPGDALARADLAWALYNSVWTGPSPQQRAVSDRVLAIREQLVREFPQSAEFRRELASSLRQQGILFHGDDAIGLAMLSRSIDLITGVEEDLRQHTEAIWHPTRPPDSELFRPSLKFMRRDEAASCVVAARINARLGKRTEALAMADRAVSIYRRLVGQDPSLRDFISELRGAEAFCAEAAEQTEGQVEAQARRAAAANFWRELGNQPGAGQE
jgi:serine/threonine protein kinase/tetratricopeptide (TPR) repeat protein